MTGQPRTLFTEEAIRERVDALAHRISQDYAEREPYLVGVLKGAFMFLADLSRRLTIPHHVDFVSLASYGDSATSMGDVRLLLDLRDDIRDKHVLVVDDILDSGATLGYLMKMFAARRPASLKSCLLVRKIRPRPAEITVDYLGFDIPDVWVVGYGLDYADRWRTLPYIATVETD